MSSIKFLGLTLFFLVLVLAVYFVLMASNPIPDILEARNLLSARECLEHHRWLEVTLYGEPRVRKPPLPTWIAALAMKAAGTRHDLVMVRLPNLAMILMLCYFTYLLARQWLDPAASGMAALVMISSAGTWDIGRSASWDAFAFPFALGGLVFLFLALKRGKNRLLWTLASGLFWGISFLSKGPVTFHSVLLPFPLALLLTGEFKNLHWRALPAALLVALPLGCWWWLYLALTDPQIFSLVGSEIESWSSYHVRPPWYYGYAFFPLVLPWVPSLVGAVTLAFRRSDNKAEMPAGPTRSQLKFFLIWLALTLLVLSFIPQKKERYAFPGLWPASLAIVSFWQYLDRHTVSRWSRLIWNLQILPVALAALAASPLTGYLVFSRGVSPLLLLPLPILLLGGIKIWRTRHTPRHSAGWAILATLLLVIIAACATASWDESSQLVHSELERLPSVLSGYHLYLFGPDERLSWFLTQPHAVIDIGTPLTRFPAAIIVDEDRQDLFRQWLTRHPILNPRELHRFRFGEKNRWLVIYRLALPSN